MAAALDYSIVVPTFDGRRRLVACLEALDRARTRTPGAGETIVVDDGSADGSAAFVRDRFPSVRVLENARNRGFAAAANRGLAAAGGAWIGLVNDDVVVDRDWIVAALAEGRAGDVASIATRILRAGEPDVVDSAGDDYSRCGFALPGRSGRPSIDEPARDCFSACAAAAFYRRSTLEQVGLLRESLGSYYEDVDLGFRLNLAGYRCRYAPGAIAWHEVGASYDRRSWPVRFRSTRNRTLVFAANMPLSLLLSQLPRHGLLTLAQIAFGPTLGDRLARALGALAVFGRLPEIARVRRSVARLRRLPAADLEGRLVRLGPTDLVARARAARRPTAVVEEGR